MRHEAVPQPIRKEIARVHWGNLPGDVARQGGSRCDSYWPTKHVFQMECSWQAHLQRDGKHLHFAAHRVTEREQILGDALALRSEQRAKLFVMLVAVKQLGFEGFLAFNDFPLILSEEKCLTEVGSKFCKFAAKTLDRVFLDEPGNFALSGLVALILDGNGVGTLTFQCLFEAILEFGAATIEESF